MLLGAHTAGLGQGGVTQLVGTNDAGGGTGTAREGEPHPATQARGVGARSRDRSCDFPISEEEGTTKLFTAKVIMHVMASNGPKGVRRAEPLI